MPEPLLDLLRAQATAEPADEIGERILDAALERFSTAGVRRASVEDIARACSINRVTVYRRFASKQVLLQAVVAREAQRFFAAVDTATRELPQPADRFVEGVAIGFGLAREHPLTTRLLADEPETILPVLTHEAEPVVGAGRTLLAALLRDAGTTAPDPDVAAEILLRLAISLLLTPAGAIPATDPEELRAFARAHLLPIAGL
ncbi:MAG TPA: helix-turn-helix domain-containing protein [Solirubrobacteraceae bacterium]|nr:helix-turn-helix domain-containing protein [Solirubrobacteraceae bacterium]